MPPAKGVSSGPQISASQVKRSSSERGPAVMPSGGEERRFLYSWKRRFEATVEAMVGGGRGGRMGGVWAGFSAVEDEFWNWGADTSGHRLTLRKRPIMLPQLGRRLSTHPSTALTLHWSD